MSLISKFKSLKKKVYYWYLSTHNPRKLAEHLYIDATGKKEGINWEHPRDLNEKINWLKFNTDTTKWSELADKYAVRSFVEEKGFGRYLVPLLGVWSNADQIDFSKLPNSFVLKTNNGAGTVMVVEDKSIIDETQVRTLLNKWLKKQFGLKQAEPHYLKIKPLIIAEAMLKEKSLISSSLIDYKIWCFGGKAFGTFVCYDRYRFAKKVEWYDKDWNYHPEWLSREYCKLIDNDNPSIPKPKSYDEMIRMAEILSEGFPEVRVDLYNIEGQIYFGEMTFTASGGHMNSSSDEVLLEMGKLIKLPTDK